MSRRLTLSLGIAVLALSAALLATTFHSAGAGMDEGRLIAYPEFVQDGEVPGRDFETFYGPANPYLTAAVFSALGPSVEVERLIGIGFKLTIVASLFLLLIPWGRWIAALGALISLTVMLPLGAGAIDWFGGLACALLGLGLLAERLRNGGPSGGRVLSASAGFVSAAALLFRPDLAPAVILSSLPLVLALNKSDRLRYGAGFGIGLLPLVAWLVAVGPDKLGKLLEDLNASRPGRRLPLSSPLTSPLGKVLLASALSSIGLLATWAYCANRRIGGLRTRLLLSFGLFSLAILPSALQRADDAHVLAVGCVSMAFIPAILDTVWTSWGKTWRFSAAKAAAAVGVGAIAIVGFAAIVHSSGLTLASALGVREADGSFDVTHDGRSFPIESPGVAAGLNSLLPEVDRLTEPGDSIFVGPMDLRRTTYADTYLYHLLPDLAPASFYTELNPGTASKAGSGFAAELGEADVLLLTSFYDSQEEPDASLDLGSPAAEQVREREFCQVAQAGSYRLYRRCDSG